MMKIKGSLLMSIPTVNRFLVENFLSPLFGPNFEFLSEDMVEMSLLIISWPKGLSLAFTLPYLRDGLRPALRPLVHHGTMRNPDVTK